MKRRAPALVAIAGLVAALLATAGCARAAKDLVEQVTGERAYDATMRASSADIVFTYSVRTGDPKKAWSVTESGPYSWATNQGDLTTTTIWPGMGRMTGVELIEGNVVYSKDSFPDLPGASAGGDKWTKTTYSGHASQQLPSLLFLGLGILSSGTSATGGLTPSTILGLVRAKASSVDNLGREVLNWARTTHYRARIPLARLGPVSANEVDQAEKALGVESLTVDYWVDNSNLLRQLQWTLTIRQAPPETTTTESGEIALPIRYPVTMSVTLALSNYGIPVHFLDPPDIVITSREKCDVSADGDVSCG